MGTDGLVQHGKHESLLLIINEEDRIRKAAQERAPNLCMNDRKLLGYRINPDQHLIDSDHELVAESQAPRLVPIASVL